MNYLNGPTADKLVKFSTKGVLWLHRRDCAQRRLVDFPAVEPALHNPKAQAACVRAQRPSQYHT